MCCSGIDSVGHRSDGLLPATSHSANRVSPSLSSPNIGLGALPPDPTPSLVAHHSTYDPATAAAARCHSAHPLAHLQYMDNRSAVQYLGTCKQLHGLYHSFPLTEPVSALSTLP